MDGDSGNSTANRRFTQTTNVFTDLMPIVISFTQLRHSSLVDGNKNSVAM